MAATTVEKALFIGIGLTIFSIFSVPIYNLLNDLVVLEQKTRSFHALVDTMEAGVAIVEYNDSRIYEAPVSLMDAVRMELKENGWALEVIHDDGTCAFTRTIRSWKYPMVVSFDETSRDSVLRILVEAQLLHVLIVPA